MLLIVLGSHHWWCRNLYYWLNLCLFLVYRRKWGGKNRKIVDGCTIHNIKDSRQMYTKRVVSCEARPTKSIGSCQSRCKSWFLSGSLLVGPREQVFVAFEPSDIEVYRDNLWKGFDKSIHNWRMSSRVSPAFALLLSLTLQWGVQLGRSRRLIISFVNK